LSHSTPLQTFQSPVAYFNIIAAIGLVFFVLKLIGAYGEAEGIGGSAPCCIVLIVISIIVAVVWPLVKLFSK
jgi:hypothetical protein